MDMELTQRRACTSGICIWQGFAEDMQAILGQCTNPTRQTCLFSATLPAWVREVAPSYMISTPEIVDLVGDRATQASTDVRHLAIGAPGPMSARASTINDVIAMYAVSGNGRVIVFCDTKAECDALSTAEALRLEAKVCSLQPDPTSHDGPPTSPRPDPTSRDGPPTSPRPDPTSRDGPRAAINEPPIAAGSGPYTTHRCHPRLAGAPRRCTAGGT